MLGEQNKEWTVDGGSRDTRVRLHVMAAIAPRVHACLISNLNSPQESYASSNHHKTIMSSNVEEFRQVLSSSEKIIILSGAGLSVASGLSHLRDDSPICPALKGTELVIEAGGPEPVVRRSDLPRCPKCGQLCRPGIVWFGERPHRIHEIMQLADEADLCIIVGTSAVVRPCTVS